MAGTTLGFHTHTDSPHDGHFLPSSSSADSRGSCDPGASGMKVIGVLLVCTSCRESRAAGRAPRRSGCLVCGVGPPEVAWGGGKSGATQERIRGGAGSH